MSQAILHVESFVSKILLAVMVGLVFCAGVSRWFGYPLVWSVDVAQLLFVWTSFIGADMALRNRGLIIVDLGVRWIPNRHRVFLDIVTALVVLAFLLTMVVLGYNLVMLNLERTFGDSGISYAFVTSAVPIGCLLLAGTLAGQLLTTLASFGKNPTLVFSKTMNAEETAAALEESAL